MPTAYLHTAHFCCTAPDCSQVRKSAVSQWQPPVPAANSPAPAPPEQSHFRPGKLHHTAHPHRQFPHNFHFHGLPQGQILHSDRNPDLLPEKFGQIIHSHFNSKHTVNGFIINKRCRICDHLMVILIEIFQNKRLRPIAQIFHTGAGINVIFCCYIWLVKKSSASLFPLPWKWKSVCQEVSSEMDIFCDSTLLPRSISRSVREAVLVWGSESLTQKPLYSPSESVSPSFPRTRKIPEVELYCKTSTIS